MHDQHLARILALVPCAGRGTRAGAGLAKQYRTVAGQPLIAHTLQALQRVERIQRLLLVVAPGDTTLAGSENGWELADCGGTSRAASVLAGLRHLQATGAADTDWVLVHDAARCLVAAERVDALIDACLADKVGGLLALPLTDTLKSEADGRVTATLERSGKWLAQTPQMFRLGALCTALACHQNQGFAGITDEASAMEAAGYQPLLVHGSRHNIKVTYPEDFQFADTVLRSADA